MSCVMLELYSANGCVPASVTFGDGRYDHLLGSDETEGLQKSFENFVKYNLKIILRVFEKGTS